MRRVVWAAFIALAGCQGSISASLSSASDLMYEQRYVDAERLYRKVLKRLTDQAELDADEQVQRLHAIDRLGQINSLYLANYRQAVADYELLVRLYPRSDRAMAAYAALADLHDYKLGEPEAAIDALQALAQAFDDRVEARRARLRLIAAYTQQQNYEQARTEAQQLIAKWPTSAEATEAHVRIGGTYHLQGRYREAVAAYMTLLQGVLTPDLEALVWFELGNAHQELGESRRALDCFYKCLAAHPNPQIVQQKIARIQRRLEISRPSEVFGVAEPATTKPSRGPRAGRSPT